MLTLYEKTMRDKDVADRNILERALEVLREQEKNRGHGFGR